MSMSKKDFIALADMLRTARTNVYTTADGFSITLSSGFNPFKPEHLELIADFCQLQNPNFKRERWLDYIAGKCGKNGGKVAA